jgi:hypothetical protein
MKWIFVPKRPLLHTGGRVSHFGPSRHIAPPRAVEGMAEIDGPTSIAEHDAIDPQRP